MAKRHLSRGRHQASLREVPQQIYDPAGSGGVMGAATAGEQRSDPGRPTRLAWWHRKTTLAAGFPPPQAAYQRIFAGQGRYVPHGVWRDGIFDFETWGPLNSGFGFVQVAYRYSMPIADLGAAQGHPNLRVFPYNALSQRSGAFDPLSDAAMATAPQVAASQAPTYRIPSQVRARDSY